MKETLLTNNERKFINEAVGLGLRVDGRGLQEYRDIQIGFVGQGGDDAWTGGAEVSIGETKVFCQVSCSIVEPRDDRPTEGFLHINTELSPMANPSSTFCEIGRPPTAVSNNLSIILERIIKEGRVVDTEALCIVAGAKVWSVRMDVHVMDDCGNIIDCAVLAVVCALKHFRRPDVTVVGEDVTVHSFRDRHGVPLSVHYTPICISCGFFPGINGDERDHENGSAHSIANVCLDPARKEEMCLVGKLIFAMNVHREIIMIYKLGSEAGNVSEFFLSGAGSGGQFGKDVSKVSEDIGSFNIDMDELFRCTSLVESSVQKINAVMKTAFAGVAGAKEGMEFK
eukprot:Nk52_evm8s299 gene=Nk52_evmTU8s299